MTSADIMVIQQIVGVLIIVVVAILAFFRVTGQVRNVLTTLLATIALLHYVLLFALSASVEIRLFPFFIVESKYIPAVNSVESSLYPDIGQISVTSIAVLWRREIQSLLTRWFKCECSNSTDQAVQNP